MNKNEALIFLRLLMIKINNQSNRCSASPYYFAVQSQEEVEIDDEGNEATTWVDMGIFLTEKAANEHIAKNHYHYHNPRLYVKHFRQNPEMEHLFEAISVIAEVEWKKH